MDGDRKAMRRAVRLLKDRILFHFDLRKLGTNCSLHFLSSLELKHTDVISWMIAACYHHQHAGVNELECWLF